MEDTWEPLTVGEVVERFASSGVDWWVAGGIALDLFLGWKTREHDDIDIEMFRSDKDSLFDVFPDWDLHAVSQGRMISWRRGDDLSEDTFGIWARPSPSVPWAVEIILANGAMDRWRFRRDHEITLEGDCLIRWTKDGVPHCTPEVQLLYKSKKARPKDDIDLAMVLHHMSQAQRSWLMAAIKRSDPDHPWISVLGYANEHHRD
ncbi:MAG: amino acid transporter [Actinomycetia bacterium]|nr:amino acid transporter [Actinomycetes bacterium]